MRAYLTEVELMFVTYGTPKPFYCYAALSLRRNTECLCPLSVGPLWPTVHFPNPNSKFQKRHDRIISPVGTNCSMGPYMLSPKELARRCPESVWWRNPPDLLLWNMLHQLGVNKVFSKMLVSEVRNARLFCWTHSQCYVQTHSPE